MTVFVNIFLYNLRYYFTFELNPDQDRPDLDQPEDVKCSIVISASDTSRDKAAAQVLFKFQEISNKRMEELKEDYEEPNWSYIAYQFSCVYRMNRAYAPIPGIQANTWKIDGGLFERSEEEINMENQWVKMKKGQFEDCTPIEHNPSFPISKLFEWARKNRLRPKAKYETIELHKNDLPDIDDMIEANREQKMFKDDGLKSFEALDDPILQIKTPIPDKEKSDKAQSDHYYQVICRFKGKETVGIADSVKYAKQVAAKRMLAMIREEMNLPKTAYQEHAVEQSRKKQDFFCSTQLATPQYHSETWMWQDHMQKHQHMQQQWNLISQFDMGINAEYGGYLGHDPHQNSNQRLQNCCNWLKLPFPKWTEDEIILMVLKN